MKQNPEEKLSHKVQNKPHETKTRGSCRQNKIGVAVYADPVRNLVQIKTY